VPLKSGAAAAPESACFPGIHIMYPKKIRKITDDPTIN